MSLLHVQPDESEPIPWHEFPSVRKTLENWGLLEPGSRRSDVTRKLGLRVEKVVGHDANVSDSIGGFLQDRAVDLIVIATEGRTDVPRWIKRSIAEPVAQRTSVLTLSVPKGARSCICVESGHVCRRTEFNPCRRSGMKDKPSRARYNSRDREDACACRPHRKLGVTEYLLTLATETHREPNVVQFDFQGI